MMVERVVEGTFHGRVTVDKMLFGCVPDNLEFYPMFILSLLREEYCAIVVCAFCRCEETLRLSGKKIVVICNTIYMSTKTQTRFKKTFIHDLLMFLTIFTSFSSGC